MKHRWLIIVGLLIVLTGIAAAVAFAHPREPEYGGKTLRQWLVEYAPKTIYDGGYDNEGRAAQAVRQIGTNALPWLVQWLQYEAPAWETKMYRKMEALPPKFQIPWVQRAWSPYRNDRRDRLAMWGFLILGRQAKPAVPELTRFIRVGAKPKLRTDAFCCLSCVAGITHGPGLDEGSFVKTLAWLGRIEGPDSPTLKVILKGIEPDSVLRKSLAQALESRAAREGF